MGRSTAAISARRVAGVLGGVGVGAVGGFVASLLRRRPPSIYADGLQSAPSTGSGRDHDTASGLPESPAGPTAAERRGT
jgi:hypothetical protein